MAKKSSAPGGDIARKIWLAGIGAYGSAFSEAQESLSKMGGDTSRVFDELVTKGEIIEKTVEYQGKEVMKKVTKSQTTNLDERIQKMRTKLGLEATQNSSTEIAILEKRLETIEAKLDQLLATVSAPSPKTASKKATPRKTPVKKKVATKRKPAK